MSSTVSLPMVLKPMGLNRVPQIIGYTNLSLQAQNKSEISLPQLSTVVEKKKMKAS